MEDIVNAIEKLAEKTWVDYALIGAPIILSIVAIGITIYVARKQNKIALFEKRYNCLYQLYTIGRFSKEIQNIGKESIKSNTNLKRTYFYEKDLPKNLSVSCCFVDDNWHDGTDYRLCYHIERK